MRIWIVNQYAVDTHESGGTRHAILSRHLEEQGHEVTLITGRPVGAPSIRHATAWWLTLPVPPVANNGARRIYSMSLFALRIVRLKRAAVVRPDVIVGSSPHLLGALGAYALARRLGTCFVFEVRDLWPLSLVELLGLSPRHPLVMLFGAIERFLYRRSDGIVALLQDAADHIREVAGNQAAARVTWVPNGAPALPRRDHRPEKHDQPFSVVYAGSQGPPNSLDTLIDAARIVQDDDPVGIHFDIYGDGVDHDRLRAHAQRLKLRNLSFHEPVPKSAVASILQRADAGVICWQRTNLYRFGISANKLFDYFAANLPVIIAIDAANNPVSDADAGVTVAARNPAELASAIIRMATSSKDQRQDWGRNAQNYLRLKHDPPRLAENLAEALRLARERTAQSRA